MINWVVDDLGYIRMDAQAGKFNCTPGRTIPCGDVCRTPVNCKKHLQQNPPALPQNPKLIPKKTLKEKLLGKVASAKQKVVEAVKGKPKPKPKEITAEEALPEIEYRNGKYLTKDLGEEIPSRRQQIRAVQLLFSAQEKDAPTDEDAYSMIKSLDYFTGPGHGDIRDLQMGKFEEPPPRESVERDANNIERYLANAPKYDGKIYRGMNFETEDDLNSFLKANSGGFEMNAMSSFSATQSVAESFMQGLDNRGLKVLITVPKNKSGASVKPFSSYADEDEVLVPSKTKYRVKSQRREGDTVHLEWEEI